MTQALNLGLLGNNVNTSGQVSLTAGVSGTLPVANGGTGATTLTANNVLLGNGTSALQSVAPSTNGNVLTSNGTTWTSAAPPSPAPTTAQVLTATAGASAGAVGTYALASRAGLTTGDVSAGGTLAGSALRRQSAVVGIITPANNMPYGSALSGTWRAMSDYTYNNGDLAGIALWLRIS
jgi:hypothetical protein